MRVEIVPYRAAWPEDFAVIAADLRRALGVFAVRIDHIGSTSVPGLASKDVIDVQVTVADFDPVTTAALIAALATIGYTLVETITGDHLPPGFEGDPAEWEKRYFRAPAGQRATNLHVRADNRANQRYALLFRDYLRAHPAAASGYAELKRRLADYVGEDRDNYVEIKDSVCDIIIGGAQEWARATGWHLSASDA